MSGERTITFFRPITTLRDGELITAKDEVAREAPVTIIVDGEEFATIVCSPADLEELAIGFLASEGLIRIFEDVAALQVDETKGFIYADLKVKQSIGKDYYSKRMIGSCCGKGRQFYFHNDARTAKTIISRQTITVSQCFAFMEEMQRGSAHFRRTGGVHNAALFSEHDMLASFTDIGRHNTLDKLYGYCLKHKIPAKDKIIAFSGRLSSEVILKTAKLGAGIILSKSAPTDLGLELAEELGITAVGFIRGRHLNIYSHPERIIL